MSTTLNRNAQKALYLQLAEKLMDDIASKRLLPLEKLPSEYELTQLFDVSRVTVRQALRLLADRGLVVSRQGKGVFVSGPQVSQDLNALRGFYDSLIAQGHTPETEVIDFTLSGAANPNRETLFRGYSEVAAFTRVYRVSDAVVAVAEAAVSCFGKTISRQMIETYPVYTLLHDVIHRKVERATTSIRAAQAPPRIAELMGLGDESMALQMDRTSFDSDGIVLEQTRFHIQPEIFAFELNVSGPMQIAPSLRKVE
ncbi:GntR family transcriptional regulator [Pusillimonas sp. TS35]|uniref:GntR family transcriptional regulator n=1 Tax=Paracandidimonas lactea TaxID=2895524 RepID=UPI00136D6F51|nr:GntR family transcriptional regulator [Paracandidimonas lactea]MYN14309.1 GntR family transcriptional regulator [Pusillimonas sp. TS35]